MRFIEQKLLERLETGAASLIGKVGVVEPPYLVLPLTVEPTKPRLCHDAHFLNLWMTDKPFSLDSIPDLPRNVSRDSYQTALDYKSGYDHIQLLMTDVPFPESSGVVGTSIITRCRLDGSFLPLFIIPQVMLQAISSHR